MQCPERESQGAHDHADDVHNHVAIFTTFALTAPYRRRPMEPFVRG